ncbi:unnamed protein product [Fusarium graminearum]|nr:unnamed protein product [Fusarium graminearum]
MELGAGEILTEQSEGTDGNESQNGADTVTARDNDNIIARRLSVLAHTKADGVLALAGLNVVAVNGAALIVDSGALNTALLLRARLGTVVTSITLAVVAGVALGVGTGSDGLADSRLDVRDNIPGVVAEADDVLLLANLNVTVQAALVVDSCALDTALLNSNINLLVAVVTTLGVRTRADGLADGRLDVRNNVPRVVTEADNVLLLADLNVTVQAALIVDSCALDTALLTSDLDLLVAVAVVFGVVVVLSVAGLVLLVVRLFVLADRGLDVGGNVPGVVSEANSVLLLADGNISTRNSAALIVDCSALEAAVFSGVVTLVVGRSAVRRVRVRTRLIVRAVLLVEVVLVILGLVVNVVLLLMLADGGLDVRNNVPWVVTEADSVLLLADSDISAGNGTALVVNGGTFVGADIRGEAASSATNALVIVVLGRVRLVLADGGLDVRNNVPWVVAKADSVSLLADSDVSARDGTALVIHSGTLVAADLGAGGLGGLDHSGHGTSHGIGHGIGHGGGVNGSVGESTGDRSGNVHTAGGGEVLSGGTRSHLGEARSTHGHGQKTGQSVGVSHLEGLR